ncbi:hypothetical protein Lesp02_84150 [Lentzea sp. NBRC 105346]|uniref:hypothetical protein n=1 Tax=Lentzea sp. NBRC 105346 TaxID=3032205 RepID=UPI0024A2C8CC|nr:hypothetical protein [Lentzea sp. NBRC 105346]GLZ36228.1 hypothetical protein Lesp02_84150 [Lentzea sp. NBRC 105346]
MPRKAATAHRIEFDSPATIDELVEALTELRATFGGDATPRVRVKASFNADGGHIVKVTAGS